MRAGIPIVGPGAVLHRDAALRRARTCWARRDGQGRWPGSVKTLSELLAGAPGWTPPRLDGTEVVAQPHCHHSAVMGWEADAALLRRAGAELTRLGSCCGLAGNFGMERGHYDGVRRGGRDRPAARRRGGRPDDAVVLADGFSCRTQLTDLTPRSGLHLAELLAGRLRRRPPDPAGRPRQPDTAQSRET